MISVLIPMYNASRIAWLPMESLVRQKDVPCEWELIVAEEQNAEKFGEEGLAQYKRRLGKIGCSWVHYIPLRRWIPLSRKWRLMAMNTSLSSEAIIFQAADNYLHPYGVRDVFDYIVGKGADWVAQDKMPWWFVTDGRIFLADYTRAPDRTGRTHPAGMWFSAKTKWARQLPDSDKAKGVDRWLVTEIEKIARKATGGFKNIRYPKENKHWMLSFGTHGMNTISRKRVAWHARHYLPGEKYKTLWPAEVVKRVEALNGTGVEKPPLLPRQVRRSRVPIKRTRPFRGQAERRTIRRPRKAI